MGIWTLKSRVSTRGLSMENPSGTRVREEVWHEQERAGPRNCREGSEPREGASRPGESTIRASTKG